MNLKQNAESNIHDFPISKIFFVATKILLIFSIYQKLREVNFSSIKEYQRLLKSTILYSDFTQIS